MHLWNDYEGRTIAEAYPLQKLVRPEGRSAFFLTTNGTGTPAMVRLIEAHFDEPEILARWRRVSEIKQENLVTMRKYGETTLDGTPLVYAVMEPTEMSLAELLQNRTLTIEEAKQLAASLLAALKALHSSDLVHEHIEPANILAAGETIKLRSDCVREAAADPDGGPEAAARRKATDVHDLAVVLLQAITGRRALQGSATLLPPPFDGIIRNGLSGKWGLSEMTAALGPVKTAQTAVPVPAAPPTASQPVKETPTSPAASSAQPVKQKTEPAGTLFDGVEDAKTQKPVETKPAATSTASERPTRPITTAHTPDVRHRIVKPVEQDPRRTKLWTIAAVAILLLIFFGWRLTRSGATAGASEDSRPAAAAPPAKTTSTPTPPPPAFTKPSAGRGAKVSTATATPMAPTAQTSSPTSGTRTQWHVVAYTYNHEAQAQQKVAEIQKQHSSLNPEVFSPTGHAPYLVTVGGVMSRDQAVAFKQKARSEGMPRDVYVQNYDR
ncbi:MAG TPA: SPOR domain-containing protein [Edaphobacter sp.]|jgi:hypothetical protein